MGKSYLFQNIIITSFLFFYLYAQINCQVLTQNNIYNKNFLKYNATFNTEIKQKLSIVTNKMTKVKYNVVLKMKYYEINTIYEAIAKSISLLEQLISENNWDQDNENKFSNEVKNFEKNSIQFNSLYNDFNKLSSDYTKLYQDVKKFLKIFFTVLFIICFLILISAIAISFFVLHRQRRYYRLNEEVSLHIEQGKNSETSKIRQKINEKREPAIQIRETKNNYGPSSRNEIVTTDKKQNTLQKFKSDDKENDNV